MINIKRIKNEIKIMANIYEIIIIIVGVGKKCIKKQITILILVLLLKRYFDF